MDSGNVKLDAPASDAPAPSSGYGHRTTGNASRRQGEFDVPDIQGHLDETCIGQVVFCPSCGLDHELPRSTQRLECGCGALYTLSVGRSRHGDVAVVRMDRYR